MRILFNCSNNVVGGAIQNAANFIKYSLDDRSHDFYYIVSPDVAHILEAWEVLPDKLLIVDSPAGSISSISKMKQYEKKCMPDLVYTMAGPTYVKFKARHVLGVSDPYITHADKNLFFLNRSFFQALKLYITAFVKGCIARLSAKQFIFQTETSRNGFCDRYLCRKENTYVVSNAIGGAFLSSKNTMFDTRGNTINVLVPSADYPHKNLKIILEICKLIRSRKLDYDIVFTITIPRNSKFQKSIVDLKLEDQITNIGPYSYSDAVDVYSKCDVVFMPSVLETFSTSYLEAIALKKPLVVADKPFAREICSKYASYFSPFDAEAALQSILTSFSTEVDLVEQATILNRFGSQAQRYRQIVSILNRIHLRDFKSV